MSPELMMWFMLATKMAVTALFVTAATIIAERLGAMVGALVATLPVSAGPVYVFLALDHDSTFISSSHGGGQKRCKRTARRPAAEIADHWCRALLRPRREWPSGGRAAEQRG